MKKKESDIVDWLIKNRQYCTCKNCGSKHIKDGAMNRLFKELEVPESYTNRKEK